MDNVTSAWGLAGVALTSITSIVTLVITLHVKGTTQRTYNSVNGVDEANGEEKLIDQVRQHTHDISQLKAMNEWKVGVLKQVAEQVGLVVPPLPEAAKHEERAA